MSATPSPTSTGLSELSGVSFSYGPDKPLILKNINLDIAPGEMIGLRGGDGSGKSTLIKLIRGELQPTSGHVRLDDYDPAQIERASVTELACLCAERCFDLPRNHTREHHDVPQRRGNRQRPRSSPA